MTGTWDTELLIMITEQRFFGNFTGLRERVGGREAVYTYLLLIPSQGRAQLSHEASLSTLLNIKLFPSVGPATRFSSVGTVCHISLSGALWS